MSVAEDFDPRLTPARADLAAAHLEGKVSAPRFIEGKGLRVCVSRAPLTATPDPDAPLSTELLFGEAFRVYDETDGWAWGQAEGDGYVGYVPAAVLGDAGPMPNHRVSALATHIYPAPDMKTRPLHCLAMGSLVRVDGDRTVSGFAAVDSQAEGGQAGWVYADHLVAADARWDTPLDAAQRFLGMPYLWGGRTAFGIDCSGLVQMALLATGLACPRDTDMQAAALSPRLPAETKPQPGDMVFFPGHVGLMVDETRILHANATHMAVTIDPLADVVAIIRAEVEKSTTPCPPVTCIVRPDLM